jgi:hypothetical protein
VKQRGEEKCSEKTRGIAICQHCAIPFFKVLQAIAIFRPHGLVETLARVKKMCLPANLKLCLA